MFKLAKTKWPPTGAIFYVHRYNFLNMYPILTIFVCNNVSGVKEHDYDNSKHDISSFYLL